MKTKVVHTRDEAAELLKELEASAERTKSNLRKALDRGDAAMSLLATLKYAPAGCDPLDPNRPLNLIEQLNQTFTYKAAFLAADWLLANHADHAPLILNLGTAGGTDAASEDGEIAAEVFATVDPRNNRKLQKDIERLRELGARYKYVLYLSPTTGGKPEEYEDGGVLVRRLGTV